MNEVTIREAKYDIERKRELTCVYCSSSLPSLKSQYLVSSSERRRSVSLDHTSHCTSVCKWWSENKINEKVKHQS